MRTCVENKENGKAAARQLASEQIESVVLLLDTKI